VVWCPNEISATICYMSATSTATSIIAQRDLRNRSSEVLRRAKSGETFVVTTHGEQVADLAPLHLSSHQATSRLPVRPAIRRGGWDKLPLVDSPMSSQDILDDLRGER